MSKQPYTGRYFGEVIAPLASSSAKRVVPVVMQLCQPRSVVDVGCGTGAWAAAFLEAGAAEIVGVDGDYVDRRQLLIPADRFVAHDLTQPIDLGRIFDLAVCLEVAEHLPAERAATLVASLARMANVVLFSAAIPFQGGHGHVNEQWPEYWAQVFAGHGYVVLDCLRRRFWADARVGWYYAQNMLLFVREKHLQSDDRLEKERVMQAAREYTGSPGLSIVHPLKYLSAADPANWTLGPVARALPRMIRNSLMWRVKRLRKPRTDVPSTSP